MKSSKCVRFDIKILYDTNFFHPGTGMWLNQDDPIIPQSAGGAAGEEREVHRMRHSAEVNPGIQHTPADLLQTKSQPAFF